MPPFGGLLRAEVNFSGMLMMMNKKQVPGMHINNIIISFLLFCKHFFQINLLNDNGPVELRDT